jgi:hypothetical protein
MRLTHLTRLGRVEAQERQGSQADPYAVVWLDEYVDDPTEAGPSPSGIYLPRKAGSVEEWYNSSLITQMRAKLREPGDRAC